MQNPLRAPVIKVLKIGSSRVAEPMPEASPSIAPPQPSPKPEKEASPDINRKEALLRQVESEIERIRYDRAQVHLKYFRLLNHELLPKASKAEFLMIYEEIESFSGRMKELYLKKRQIELTGEYKAPRALDDATKNKIDSLKNEKKRISDNKYKTQKLIQKAKVEGNEKNVLKYEKKLAELDLKWMECESRIEKLTHV